MSNTFNVLDLLLPEYGKPRKHYHLNRKRPILLTEEELVMNFKF